MSRAEKPAFVVEPWLHRSTERLAAAVTGLSGEDPALTREEILAIVHDELLPDVLQSLLCIQGSHAASLAWLREHPPYEHALYDLPDVCAKPREILAALLTQLLVERLESLHGRVAPWDEILDDS